MRGAAGPGGLRARWRELRRDLSFAAGLARGGLFDCVIQLTNRCPASCDHCACWSRGAPPGDELTLAELGRLEAELAGRGPLLVSLEGGEPLLRPDLVAIVRLFAARHLPLLYTNGWLVDRAAARALFAAGLVQVGVSIDFSDAARHDAAHHLPGAWQRAWHAVEELRDAAPHGGRQVVVMTLLQRANEERGELQRLLEQSAACGVGHALTVLSTARLAPPAGLSTARGGSGQPAALLHAGAASLLPRPGLAARLVDLWERYPHLRVWREYLARVDDFLTGGQLPPCRAGRQTFNVDHLGNVAPCLEHVDRPVGSLRREPLAALLTRLRHEAPWVAGCQECWTLCRGYAQLMGAGGSVGGWRDLLTRMRAG